VILAALTASCALVIGIHDVPDEGGGGLPDAGTGGGSPDAGTGGAPDAGTEGGLSDGGCGAASCPDGCCDLAGACVTTTSDTQCGSHGAACVACGTGMFCSDAGTAKCSPNTCADGVQDGTETAADCGGGQCPPCADGKDCQKSTDCLPGHGCDVTTHVCEATLCNDGVRDGDETDADCGGSCPTKCALGKICFLDSDCASVDVCGSNKCALPWGAPCAQGTDCASSFCGGSPKVCGADTLVSGQDTPSLLRTDAVNLYWYATPAAGGAIMKVPTGGGTPVSMTFSSVSQPSCLAVDPTYVYYTSYGSAYRMLISSVGVQPAQVPIPASLVPTDTFYECVAASATGTVYSAVTTGTGAFTGVVRMPASGTAAAFPTTCAGAMYTVVANSTTAYAVCTSGPTGNLFSVSLTDGTTSGSLATGIFGGFAIDASNVYWIQSGGVVKMPLPSGSPQMLAAIGSGAQIGIALDANYVYWTENDPSNGSVMRVPIRGGTAVALATGQSSPGGIASDASYVYWTTDGVQSGSGAVVRAHK
jgi:hypothetical protein